jgi:hypothetical protein
MRAIVLSHSYAALWRNYWVLSRSDLATLTRRLSKALDSGHDLYQRDVIKHVLTAD